MKSLSLKFELLKKTKQTEIRDPLLSISPQPLLAGEAERKEICLGKMSYP